LFRFEIWVHKSITPDSAAKLKDILQKEFKSSITVKDIE